MKRDRNLWLSAVPFLLGYAVLSTLLIPFFALNDITRLIALAAMCGILVLVLKRRSLKLSLLFVAVMAIIGWAIDVIDANLAWYYAGAGFVLVLIAQWDSGSKFVWLIVACLAAALVLALCQTGLMVYRKENELMRALTYCLSHEWQRLIAISAGSFVGRFINELVL